MKRFTCIRAPSLKKHLFYFSQLAFVIASFPLFSSDHAQAAGPKTGVVPTLISQGNEADLQQPHSKNDLHSGRNLVINIPSVNQNGNDHSQNLVTKRKKNDSDQIQHVASCSKKTPMQGPPGPPGINGGTGPTGPTGPAGPELAPQDRLVQRDRQV